MNWEEIRVELLARNRGYEIGDRWRNPRGRVYKIVSIVTETKAVVRDEETDKMDEAFYLLIHPDNGWVKL